MSSILGANQRDTVKDLVLADYQVPKGVSIYKVSKVGFLAYDGLCFGRYML
jgi:hypothetical protein